MDKLRWSRTPSLCGADAITPPPWREDKPNERLPLPAKAVNWRLRHTAKEFYSIVATASIMITLNPALLERIRNINWFHETGESLESSFDFEIVGIQTREETPIYYHSEVWEDAELQAQNALSSFLSRDHKAEYRE